MTAPALIETGVDPMAAVRALNRMRRAGVTLTIEDDRLIVTADSQLTDAQRAYLRAHKSQLVGLLADADRLAAALEQAGTAGLGFREGTPPEWDKVYRLAVAEVLYQSHRMVSLLGRCYATAFAPPLPRFHDAPQTPEIEPRAAVAA